MESYAGNFNVNWLSAWKCVTKGFGIETSNTVQAESYYHV